MWYKGYTSSPRSRYLATSPQISGYLLIQQQFMYSSSILSATPTIYDPCNRKAIYTISHPSKRHQSIRLSYFPDSYTFIHPTSHYVNHWSIQPTIQQQSMYSSSCISVTQTSNHAFIHIAIYPISHPSNQYQSIHPSNLQVSHASIHPTSHFFIHWSIQPTIEQ